MSNSATVRIMSPEEITSLGSSEVPYLRLPARTTYFAEREMRLRQLSRQHAMGDFLGFMAEVAHAQQSALTLMADAADIVLPDTDALARAAQRGLPALPAADWVRSPAWQRALHHIVQSVQAKAPSAAQSVLSKLQQSDAEWLEAQATALLDTTRSGLHVPTAPLIGAALQTYWVHMVTSLQARYADMQPSSIFGRTDDASTCPCCGSLPTASIIRDAGGALAQRYLHCSLCGGEWHMQRTECSHCHERGQLAYQSLDAVGNDEEASSRAAQAAVQAETCDHCHHYLKILHTERDAFVDPVADDLATITLDLLVAETGQRRHGTNLALIFGDPVDGAA